MENSSITIVEKTHKNMFTYRFINCKKHELKFEITFVTKMFFFNAVYAILI
jgi:hypothetical protein